MIIEKDDWTSAKRFSCSRELASGILACQKENLFRDPERVLRLLGFQPYALFANFSNTDIEAAVHEAEAAKVDEILIEVVVPVVEVPKEPEPAKAVEPPKPAPPPPPPAPAPKPTAAVKRTAK